MIKAAKSPWQAPNWAFLTTETQHYHSDTSPCLQSFDFLAKFSSHHFGRTVVLCVIAGTVYMGSASSKTKRLAGTHSGGSFCKIMYMVADIKTEFQARDAQNLKDPHIEAATFLGTGENFVLKLLSH